MVQASVVEEQLRRIGANFKFWNRPEINELPKILFEGEEINHVVNGRYEGGFAILVSTNLRVILIDKKPFFLTLEDIRYERIADVELNHRLLDATLRLGALTKDLKFTGYNPGKMRELTSYIQERVMESRQSRQTGSQSQISQQFQPYQQPVMGTVQPAQASEAQTEAIGQVAVTAAEEAISPYEQLINIITMPASSQDVVEPHESLVATQPPTNPYRTPISFRRRVSRFY